MKKAEINATVKDAFTKFDIAVPSAKEVTFDRKSSTIRVHVVGGRVVGKLVNSLARTWGVKPETVHIESANDQLLLEFPLAA